MPKFSKAMLILGYIISKTGDKFFSEDIFKYVSSEKDCTLNVPKLIVGLKEAKKYAEEHGFDFDIMEHGFPDGNRWTFKKTEKRDIYEKDVVNFKDYIKERAVKTIRYYYVNIYKMPYSKKKKLYDIIVHNLYGRKHNYILCDKNMIYYPLKEGNVIGISLEILEYLGVNKEKIMARIKSNQANKIFYPSSQVIRDIKSQFDENEYVIPYLLQDTSHK